MAELAPGPVRSGPVAALRGKRTTALGPTPDGLIEKAVPMFDTFMRRWIPDLASVVDRSDR